MRCAVVDADSDLSDGQWEEEEEEAEGRSTTCLLCPEELPSPSAVLLHCAEAHHFNLRDLKEHFRTCKVEP